MKPTPAMRRLTSFIAFLATVVNPSAQTIEWPSAMDAARQRSDSLHCINQLKQIGLAARIWSLDNWERCPTNFPAFANELQQPELLYCPANHARPAATNWSDVEWSRIDYVWYYTPGIIDGDPEFICCRCLVHGNYGKADGSVVLVGKYPTGWPAVIAAPVSQFIAPGSNVLFQVRIAPDAQPPVSYQWRKQWMNYVTNVTYYPDPGVWITNMTSSLAFANLAGQTNASLLIANAQATNSDFYGVAISNALGVAVTAEVRLWVDPTVPSMATNEYWSAVHCINNLRTLWYFGALWASDHADELPHLSVMTNAWGAPVFGWPAVLFCRSDGARTAPTNWAHVNWDDLSYEVAPTSYTNWSAVYSRCKVHGYCGRVDGTVIFQANFTGIRSLAWNVRELNFALSPGRTNVLEMSTNLTDWIALREYSPSNGLCRLNLTNALARQFYRIRTE